MLLFAVKLGFTVFLFLLVGSTIEKGKSSGTWYQVIARQLITVTTHSNDTWELLIFISRASSLPYFRTTPATPLIVSTDLVKNIPTNLTSGQTLMKITHFG